MADKNILDNDMASLVINCDEGTKCYSTLQGKCVCFLLRAEGIAGLSETCSFCKVFKIM